jgi:nitrite reductase/ring-hydroxylating ferredoxin subunit
VTVVCAASELAPGTLLAAIVDEQPVVVVRTAAGELHAWVDRCLHQGARLSGGRLLAATEGDDVGEYRMAPDAEVLKCPWHGYEYDVRSGCGLFDRRRRLRRVAVDERDGMIVAYSPARRSETVK